MLILASCGNKKIEEAEDNTVTSDTTVNTSPDVIYTNNYDNLPYESVLEYSEVVDKNDAWLLDGDGSFDSGAKTYALHLNGDSTFSASNLLFKAGSYTISFNIGGDVPLKLDVYNENGTFLSSDISVGDNSFKLNFNNNAYDVNIVFSLYGSGDLDINNFDISCNNRVVTSLTNQVTYLNNLEKAVVFRCNPGNHFSVYDSDGNVVYSGDISKAIEQKDSAEWLYKAYFKDLDVEGTYYIKSEFGVYSNDFDVSNGYGDLIDSVLNALYVERCGYDTEGVLGHSACHNNQSKLWSYDEEVYLDTSGGWHDAGDYGKYLVVEDKVIADLLFAAVYGKNNNSSLYDEIKYGLEFILKLQKSDGSVYNKVVTKNFSSFVSPEYDNDQEYVLYSWTLVTSSFAGVTGLAYELFKDSDSDLANRCLNAHNKAIEYLVNNEYANNPKNPDGFNVGTYYDDDESDERLFAYSVAYKLTRDEKYLKLCQDRVNNGIDRDNNTANCRVYAYACLLDSLEYNSDFYNHIKDLLKSECDGLSDHISSNVYAYPIDSYIWGSNQVVCETINELLLASRYLKDERYVVKASEAINYLLGLNTLNMSFVYEFGYNYPKTIHSRLAYSKGLNSIKGALCNGVDQYLSDGEVGKYFTSDSPIATRFVDNRDSYSNVEPAINYNSSLYLALSLLEYANNNKLQ